MRYKNRGIAVIGFNNAAALRTAAIATVMVLPAFCSSAVLAQSYPNKPLRLILGIAPGGGIAATMVANANPDSYTLMMGTISSHGINPALYCKPGNDAIRDFAPGSHALAARDQGVRRDDQPSNRQPGMCREPPNRTEYA